MNAITYNPWNPRHLGFVIVFTVLLNGSLFAALPWLTRIVDIDEPTDNVSPYIFFPKTQPKPPEPVRDRRIIEQELPPLPRTPKQPDTMQNNSTNFDFVVDVSGDGVPVLINDPDKTVPIWDKIIVPPSQLDKEPRILRRVRPVYPFAAKAQGITARVKIRCLVDKNGMPQNIVAAECDPEDVMDIFGPPAVKAVEKWRFSPGEIGGDPVVTKVVFHLLFEMDY
jgi:TonB family protein